VAPDWVLLFGDGTFAYIPTWTVGLWASAGYWTWTVPPGGGMSPPVGFQAGELNLHWHPTRIGQSEGMHQRFRHIAPGELARVGRRYRGETCMAMTLETIFL
jgi:hypothetical protein